MIQGAAFSAALRLEEYKHLRVKKKGHLHEDTNENGQLQDLGTSVSMG